MKNLTLKQSVSSVATALSLCLVSFAAPVTEAQLDSQAQAFAASVSESGKGTGTLILVGKSGVLEATLFNERGDAAWKVSGKVSASSLSPMAQGMIIGKLRNTDGKTMPFAGKFTGMADGPGMLEAYDSKGTKLFEGAMKFGQFGRDKSLEGKFELSWKI